MRKRYIPIISLIVAAIAIVTPIRWDMHQSRIGLELQWLESSRIFAQPGNMERISISYGGKQISVLSKHVFSLVNTGRTPIRKQDVLEPVKIHLEEGIELLEVKSAITFPNNLDHSILIDSKQNTITIDFELLNPDDYIRLEMLVASLELDFVAQTRIVGLKELTVRDIRRHVTEIYGLSKSVITLIWFAVIFAAILSIWGFYEAVFKEPKLIKARKAGKYDLSESTSAGDIQKIIEEYFSHRIDDELRSFKLILSAYNTSDIVKEKDRSLLEKELKELAKYSYVSVTIGIVGLILVGIVWWALSPYYAWL